VLLLIEHERTLCHAQRQQEPCADVKAHDEIPKDLVVGGVRISADFPVELKWVTPQLAIGTMIGSLRNMRILANAGITHVINLQDDFDDATIVGDTGVQVYWLRIGGPIAQAPIEGAMEFARVALRDPDHSLFIHCVAGRNRSPHIAYAALRMLGVTDSGARSRIRKAEPDAVMDDDVLRQLSQRVQADKDEASLSERR
jgi:hypothetical protein